MNGSTTEKTGTAAPPKAGRGRWHQQKGGGESCTTRKRRGRLQQIKKKQHHPKKGKKKAALPKRGKQHHPQDGPGKQHHLLHPASPYTAIPYHNKTERNPTRQSKSNPISTQKKETAAPPKRGARKAAPPKMDRVEACQKTNVTIKAMCTGYLNQMACSAQDVIQAPSRFILLGFFLRYASVWSSCLLCIPNTDLPKSADASYQKVYRTSLNLESREHQTAKASHPKSTDQAIRRLCAKMRKEACFRKGMQDNSPTCEAMESWGQIASGPRKAHKLTLRQRQAHFGH